MKKKVYWALAEKNGEYYSYRNQMPVLYKTRKNSTKELRHFPSYSPDYKSIPVHIIPVKRKKSR